MPKEIKEKLEDWEKEFDEIAYFLIGKPAYKIIKSFIRQLLKAEKQKWFKELKLKKRIEIASEVGKLEEKLLTKD